MFSLVIPVYQNEQSITPLLKMLESMNTNLDNQLEVVFVVDGSPDQSYALLKKNLSSLNFTSKLILLSRNFGSFSAINAGLEHATGKYFAVMAADLQEPPELILKFFNILATEPIDVTFGVRNSRKDPFLHKIPANIFWLLYRKFIQSDIPSGGIDVFGCNLQFRNQLLELKELNSSLIGLACWLGFRRQLIPYDRLERSQGKSAWKFGKKVKYAMDSSFAFTDLPIKLLYAIGAIGISFSIIASSTVILLKLFGMVPIPGYSATIITIVFFAALNLFGLGIIGSYVWRAYENTKLRPRTVVMSITHFNQELFHIDISHSKNENVSPLQLSTEQ